jgi:hypothetical protein
VSDENVWAKRVEVTEGDKNTSVRNFKICAILKILLGSLRQEN